VLRVEHENAAGPVHPVGNVESPEVTERPVATLPSSVANVIATAFVELVVRSIGPLGAAVPTTLSWTVAA
jgi:hypothetical protein